MSKIFMVVSKDKYELPYLICDTMQEVADKLNLSVRQVTRYVNNHVGSNDLKIKYKIVKVILSTDEE